MRDGERDKCVSLKPAPVRLRRGVAGLALLVASLGVAAPAHAQVFFNAWGDSFSTRFGPGEPPPGAFRDEAPLRRAEIRDLLARRGYTIQTPIQRNGDVFIVEVVDQRNRFARLIVDAYDGQILERFAGAPPRPAVGLRNEGPLNEGFPPVAAAPRFGDDPFEDADRFEDRRAARGTIAPEVRTPRRLEDVDPRLARQAPDRLGSVAPQPVETRPLAAPEPAAPPRASAPAKPLASEAMRPEVAKPEPANPVAVKPEVAKPELAKPQPRPERRPVQQAKPEPPAAPTAKPAAEAKAAETKPPETKPAEARPAEAKAPRVIPLFKVPEDQRAAAAEGKATN